MSHFCHLFTAVAHRSSMIALLCFSIVSCGAKKSVTKEQGPVAMSVGQRQVLLSELQADLDDLAKRHNPLATKAERFLPEAVDRFVALERAKELGLDQDPQLRRQWENLMIGLLQQRELDQKLTSIKITDDEIAAHYEKKKSSLGRPAQWQIALLFLSIPKNASSELTNSIRARMEQARELSLKLPADTKGFGALAMEYSEEPTSRFKGGDVGWLEDGATAYRWPKEVIEAARSLPTVGEISQVIATPEGFFLIRKIDSREPVVRPLEGRLKSSIASAVMAEKRQSMEKELKLQWQKQHPVEMNQKVLSQLKYHAIQEETTPSPAP